MDVDAAIFRDGKVLRRKDLPERGRDHQLRRKSAKRSHALRHADLLTLEHRDSMFKRKRFHRRRRHHGAATDRLVRLRENMQRMARADEHLQRRERKIRRPEESDPHSSSSALSE